MKPKTNRKRLQLLCSVSCLLFCIFGCATPRTAYFLNIHENSQREIKKDGLTVRIEPITWENYTHFPNVYDAVSYTTREGQQGWFNYYYVNMPAFELTMTNETGHILMFDRLAMKLQDEFGEVADALTQFDLIDFVDFEHKEDKAQGNFWKAAPLKSKIRRLKLVDRNFELVPNITERGYISFNIEKLNAYGYNNYLAARKYLKILLYEIPVKTDSAGTITKTTNFEFLYDTEARKIQP